MSKPEQHVLSNGIPVIFQNFEGLVAASYWWIQAGSCDESPAEAGFAHFLEHMLFKDAAAKETGQASTGKMARAIESLGGDINAYTSFDQTVYHVTCAAEHWEKILDAFGTMAKPQRFLKSDFEREREVILEELRKNEDSPGRQLFQGLFSTTFKKHPYGKPVIGYVKTLKAATVGSLEAFYRRNYVSAKMGIVLVGPISDVRKKALIKLLEKRFGQGTIPRKAGEKRPRPTEPELRKGMELLKMPFDVKTPTVAYAFRAPALGHRDIPALDLAGSVLGSGELSRLYQRLFYKESIATEASGGLYVPADPGMLYFQTEVDEIAKINRASEMMFEEMDRLRREGPTPEEFDRVLVNAESEKLYATQTVDGMAGRIGFLRFILGDLGYDRDYLEQLRSLRPNDIRQACSTYLDPQRMSGVFLLPKASADFDVSGVEAMAGKILATTKPAVVAARGSRAKGTPMEATWMRRPSGLRVAYRNRTESSVFSIHASVLGGLRYEIADPVESADKDWGVSNMMALSWDKGAGKGVDALDANAISTIVEGAAASIDGFSGRNTVGLQATGLSRDWEKLSGLFSKVLVEPAFSDSEVEHSRRVAEDSVRGIEDHSSQLCTKLFLETLFENHPYGRLTTGSLESLATMNGAKLREFHRRWVRAEDMVVSVVGAVRETDLEDWLISLEARLASVAGGEIRRKPEIPAEPALKAPRWVERSLGREQVHILVGGMGTRIHADDRYALRLLQTILGGQSGRLFIELREKKSLAYTVAPVSFEGLEPGYVGTYIASSPSKRDEAVGGIRAVLEKMAEKGPTPAEMSRAREYFLGRRAMDLQSDTSLASHYGLEYLYGIEHLDEKSVAQRIRKVTAREIQAACRKYLVEPHRVTAVVG